MRGLPSAPLVRFSSPSKTTSPPPALNTSAVNDCTKLVAISSFGTGQSRLAVPDSRTYFPFIRYRTLASEAEKIVEVLSALAVIEAPHHFSEPL